MSSKSLRKKCSLCQSIGVTKSTCPLNPEARNPKYRKHYAISEQKGGRPCPFYPFRCDARYQEYQDRCQYYFNNPRFKNSIDRQAHQAEDDFINYIEYIYNQGQVNEDLLMNIIIRLDSYSIPRRICQRCCYKEFDRGHQNWIRGLRFIGEVPGKTGRPNVDRDTEQRYPQFYRLSENAQRELKDIVNKYQNLLVY